MTPSKYAGYDEKEKPSFLDVITELGFQESQAEYLFNILPDHIKFISQQWGMADTVFRDEAYVFLKNLIKKELQIARGDTNE